MENESAHRDSVSIYPAPSTSSAHEPVSGTLAGVLAPVLPLAIALPQLEILQCCPPPAGKTAHSGPSPSFLGTVNLVLADCHQQRACPALLHTCLPLLRMGCKLTFANLIVCQAFSSMVFPVLSRIRGVSLCQAGGFSGAIQTNGARTTSRPTHH